MLSAYRFCATVVLFVGLALVSGCKRNTEQVKKTKKQLREEYEQSLKKTFNTKIARLNFEDTKRALSYYEEIGNKIQQAKALERMISLGQDHTIIDSLLIKLADIKFDLELFEEAEVLYQRYALLYPGAERIDYVKARNIESSYRQILDPARDQSKTKTTLKFGKQFLQHFGPKNNHYNRIEAIVQQCYYLLLESELNHVQFYIHKFSYTESPKTLAAAHKRLLHLYETVLPSISDAQATQVKKDLEAYFKSFEPAQTDEDTETSQPVRPVQREELLSMIHKVSMLLEEHRNKVMPHARDRF